MIDLNTGSTAYQGFIDKVDLELRRAERYRIFVALVVLDLSTVAEQCQVEGSPVAERLLGLVRANTREIDQVAVLHRDRLGLLLPETTRQGAEVAGRRLIDLIRKDVSKQLQREISEMIAVEMASYPDSSGAKTIRQFLGDISDASMN